MAVIAVGGFVCTGAEATLDPATQAVLTTTYTFLTAAASDPATFPQNQVLTMKLAGYHGITPGAAYTVTIGG